MAAPSPLTAETRRILALAWPVILTSLNWTILHVTDVIVVGLTGTHEVAALGASRAITYIGIVVTIGWMSGILVYVSRADGAGDRAGTGALLHQGLAAALLLGFASGGILFAFAEPLLLLVGVEAGLAPAAARIVRIMAVAYPFQLITIAASFFLEGISRPRRVMAVNLSILPLNALLAWAMSGGHFGFPAMGAAGAAGATAIACGFGMVAILAAAWTLPAARERGVRAVRGIDPRVLMRGAGALLAFGAMPALASGLELAGFSILIALSTQLGEATTHAFQIVFTIHNVTFGVALGLGSAAGVRVGNAVGEGVRDQARHRAMIAAGLAAGFTGVLAVGLLVGGPAIVALYPATDAVRLLAVTMLAVWAPFVVFDGIQVVLVYALRSLGDQVVAGLNGIASFFVITGATGWLLYLNGWGAMALVWASAAGMISAAVLNGARMLWITRAAAVWRPL